MPARVTFSESVLVSRLPSAEFLDAHKARVPPKHRAAIPFSDEIWDGAIQNFREVELTPQEFALLKDASSTGSDNPINKFARMVGKLVLGEDMDLVLSNNVKRVNNDEYGEDRPSSVALTKAVAVGYDEHGNVIWEELSVEELQKRRGSLRRFQPSSPPMDPPPREASTSGQLREASTPGRDAESVEIGRTVSNHEMGEQAGSIPMRKTLYNQRATQTPNKQKINFKCGEFRIEFVEHAPLQAGGDTRGRAENLDEEDDAMFPPPAEKSRSRSLVKIFRQVFKS
ncbi:hypothetical protein BASA81_006630 [Batrachochytrium salamandrivorans]|nr:hypothetical protein BASA81_006630 [Batrachochytrium salamandrivorans]